MNLKHYFEQQIFKYDNKVIYYEQKLEKLDKSKHRVEFKNRMTKYYMKRINDYKNLVLKNEITLFTLSN